MKAFFSETAASMYGTCIWRTSDGGEAEITAMDPTETGYDYKFADKIPLEVTEFLRQGGEYPLGAPRPVSYFGYPK